MSIEVDNPAVELPWSEFDRLWKWNQSEHITLVGPTGRGKTTLETAILPRRDYVVFFSTKRQDSSQDKLRAMGYKVIHSAKDINPDVAPLAILRPPWPDNVSAKQLKTIHAEVYGEALMTIFRQGYWTAVLDEGRYLSRDLGLEGEIQLLLLQGRSLMISVILGTQRPRWVPLEAYDQATHMFFFKDKDRTNLERVAELAGLDRRTVQEIVPAMDKHQLLYANRDTDELVTTQVEV